MEQRIALSAAEALPRVVAVQGLLASVKASARLNAETIVRHRAALDEALASEAATLSLDLHAVETISVVGADLVCEAALRSQARGVALRLLGSDAVWRLLAELQLEDASALVTRALALAVVNPLRLSAPGFASSLACLDDAQLAQARTACRSRRHAATTSETRVAIDERLGLVLREQRRRLARTRTRARTRDRRIAAPATRAS